MVRMGCSKGFLFPDIDECLSSSCEGHCVNTEGGFVCECGPGMQLSADRHSCQGEWVEEQIIIEIEGDVYIAASESQ